MADLNDPFLLDAVGRCPPEDVGGPWGYQEFREALANKNHERHDELVEWWGSADYDPAAIDGRWRTSHGSKLRMASSIWPRLNSPPIPFFGLSLSAARRELGSILGSRSDRRA
nr:hypothetical protein [Sinorhizobium medicae]